MLILDMLLQLFLCNGEIQKIDMFFKIYCWQNIETLNSTLSLEQWKSGVCGELSLLFPRTKKWEGAGAAKKTIKWGLGCGGKDNEKGGV